MGIHIDGPNSRITGDLSGNVTGVAATFTGDVGVGGTLTYEDVTNVDSVGVITARDGLRVTGIATVTGNIDMKTGGSGSLILGDDQLVKFGDSNELTIQHSAPAGPSGANFIEGDTAGKNLYIRSKLNQDQLKLVPDGQVEAYFAGSKKFETTGSGTITTGIVTANSGADAVTFLKGNSVGIGTTTTAGRNAGVGTATGEIIYNASDSVMQVWSGTLWETVTFKPPINVSGGTVSGSARSGYVTHTFTSSGSLVTDGALTSAEIFVIGGGGGGGGNRYGGGGGAGGANYGTGITLPAATHPVTIGAGGAGGSPASPVSGSNGNPGSDGGHTSFQASPSPLYRTGRGGGAGSSYNPPNFNGRPGGCGGGAASATGASGGGQGQTAYNSGKPTNYGQPGAGYMNAGSPSNNQNGWGASGGGGIGQAGFGPPSPGVSDQRFRGGGNGGDGVQLSISGTATYYGGGGGGSSFSYVTPPDGAGGGFPGGHVCPDQMKCRGGNGGGGTGNNQPNSAPTQHGPNVNPFAAGTGGSSPNQHGVTNTGSGGSGAQPTYSFSLTGGNGGSGVVIVAYPKTQAAGEVRF